MSSEISVKINSAEIFKLKDDSGDFALNPSAEESIVRLLQIKKQVDGAVDLVKAEIARQALEYDENFTSIKGSKIKVNYSAAGAKYKSDGSIRNHNRKYWQKKVTWTPISKAIDEHRAKTYLLPKGIIENERQKTIRITEVSDE